MTSGSPPLTRIGLYGATFRGIVRFVRGLRQATGADILHLDGGDFAPLLDHVDGLVLLHHSGLELIPLAAERKLPIVSRSITSLSDGVTVVHMDDGLPARDLARMMEQRGARSLFYRGLALPFSERREEAVRGMAAEAGLPFVATNSLEETIEALQKAVLPAGLVCMNDAFAYEMIEALKDTDLKVPEAVMVAGFDNLPLPDSPDALPLSTVDLPFEEQGKLAGKLLLEPGTSPQLHVVNMHQPVFRCSIPGSESTAPESA